MKHAAICILMIAALCRPARAAGDSLAATLDEILATDATARRSTVTLKVVDLADCSKFRQSVASRPPRIVHGTALLLLALLAAALTWA